MSSEFSFDRYIEHRRAGDLGRDDRTQYAYPGDLAMLRSFKRMRPVELAASAVVRVTKEMFRGQLLGQAVKVGPRQFPEIYRIAEECAETLSVPVPQIYVANSPVVNAFTIGTEDEAIIVLHSALLDTMDERELRFVIGHETGHIQNKHVVYGTALQGIAALLGPFAEPALVALRSWFRLAEITCDRAGLLCSRDLEAGVSSFAKLAIGSKSLFERMDIEEYIKQLEEGQETVGRYTELLVTHPFLPKRIKALRAFSESALYRQQIGQDGGRTMEEVDAETSRVIAIFRERTASQGGSA